MSLIRFRYRLLRRLIEFFRDVILGLTPRALCFRPLRGLGFLAREVAQRFRTSESMDQALRVVASTQRKLQRSVQSAKPRAHALVRLAYVAALRPGQDVNRILETRH